MNVKKLLSKVVYKDNEDEYTIGDVAMIGVYVLVIALVYGLAGAVDKYLL